MQDEEILRRLAEIEGHERQEYDDPALGVDYIMEVDDGFECWNPLERDQDALGLVKKYEVLIEECNGDGWHTMCDGEQRCDPDLNKAICLAIIEAHK